MRQSYHRNLNYSNNAAPLQMKIRFRNDAYNNNDDDDDGVILYEVINERRKEIN